MAKLDHIVTVQTSGGEEVSTHVMTSEEAHDLFARLTSYFDGIKVTLEQLVPVITKRERRLLWMKDTDDGPNQHIADAVQTEV